MSLDSEDLVNEINRLNLITSVNGIFRVDFSGRGELADRQQQLAQVQLSNFA